MVFFNLNYLVCILRPLVLLVKLILPLIWIDVFKWYIILQFINISRVKGIVVTAVNCQIIKLWCNFWSRKWDLLRWSIWNSLGKLFVTENMINLQLKCEFLKKSFIIYAPLASCPFLSSLFDCFCCKAVKKWWKKWATGQRCINNIRPLKKSKLDKKSGPKS